MSFFRRDTRVPGIACALLLTLTAACRQDPAIVQQRLIADGDRYVVAGKFSEAVIQYRHVVQMNATSGEARVKLADASLAAGDLAGALREYVRAADLRSDDLAVQLKAGNLLLLAGRFDDAKVRAEKMLAKDAGNVDAQILAANALAGLKDIDKALAQVEEALRLAPDRSGTYSSLGALELGRGKRDAAEKAFRKAVDLQPKSVAARLALGNFYWLTDRPAAAEESLNAALELDPRNPLTNRAVANFYLATNRLERAEQPLKTVFEVTRNGDSALALEEYYVTTGRDADARSMLQPMLSDARTSATANVRLAALDFKDGKHDEAYKRLTTVLAKNQANLQALLVQSSLLLSDGKVEDALSSASAAVQRHPESAIAFFALGRIQATRRQPDAAITAYQEVLRLNPRATEAKIALGKLQLQQGRPDASVGLAAEALSNEPANGDAQLLYVRGLLAQGELQRAERELRPLVARFTNSAAVHVQMGMLLARQAKSAAARVEFDRALVLRPDSLEALGGLIALDMAAGNVKSARARIDAAIASAPTAPALMLAARTYGSSGDLASAERFLRQAIQLDSSYAAAFGALGQMYMVQGKLEAARKEFGALAAQTPKSVAAHTMIGIILEAEGHWSEARDQFERVLQIDPEAAVAANNLAWIYTEHGGNLDVAMHLAQTAQKGLPGVAGVGDTLGFIYYRKNLPALAISTLKVSTEIEPENPLYHYHLGLAYSSAGDAVHAKASLTRALALKPDFNGAEDARNLLESKALRQPVSQ